MYSYVSLYITCVETTNILILNVSIQKPIFKSDDKKILNPPLDIIAIGRLYHWIIKKINSYP